MQKLFQSSPPSKRPSVMGYEIKMVTRSCKLSQVEKARGADTGDAFFGQWVDCWREMNLAFQTDRTALQAINLDMGTSSFQVIQPKKLAAVYQVCLVEPASMPWVRFKICLE